MQPENPLLKPKYGYTHQPGKGRAIFYTALAIAIFCPLYFITYRLVMGADFMHAWWAAGMLDGTKSPLRVPGMLLTFVGIVLVIWHSCTVKGWWRTLACITVGFLIAWFYEFLGVYTNNGGIFGPYHYNPDTLPFHILGVPFTVALGWEIFAYPAFYLVLYLVPSEELGEEKALGKRLLNNAVIATIGGLFCIVTDFLSDPLAVAQGFFTWHVNGEVYQWLLGSGEPLSNFTGWWICGFTMMFAWCFILQTTPSKRHYRSKYLDVYFPLALYAASFTNNFTQELLLQQRQDVTLFALFGFGGVLMILLVKLYMENQGAQPHPFGKAISEEALRKSIGNFASN